MKNVIVSLAVAMIFIALSCSKDTESEKFRLLTAHPWRSDSLLAEGIDASGPGQILEKFKGDAEFRKDGTGSFGKYAGTWRFAFDEANLVINSDSLQVPVSAVIRELNETSLKITTTYPNALNPNNPLDIRMTFKPR